MPFNSPSFLQSISKRHIQKDLASLHHRWSVHQSYLHLQFCRYRFVSSLFFFPEYLALARLLTISQHGQSLAFVTGIYCSCANCDFNRVACGNTSLNEFSRAIECFIRLKACPTCSFVFCISCLQVRISGSCHPKWPVVPLIGSGTCLFGESIKKLRNRSF